ncbi:MAG: hypothetical protein FWF68_06055 [Spirochaetes bacterium]|nr:hypothetical protein [Brevinematales bacterium]MCL1959145.1 hypothetical protein [Spirochaetota bacterium]
MKRNFKWRFAGIGAILAMIAVFGAVVMLLWNVIIPPLFALPSLNYWQAAGLLLLVRILFGGMEHSLAVRGGMRGDYRQYHGNKLREKWLNMSDEERKEFIEKEKDFFKFNRGFSRFHDFFANDEKPEQSGV